MKKRKYLISILTILLLCTNNTLSIYAQENNLIENRTILKRVDKGNSKKNVKNKKGGGKGDKKGKNRLWKEWTGISCSTDA